MSEPLTEELCSGCGLIRPIAHLSRLMRASGKGSSAVYFCFGDHGCRDRALAVARAT